MRAGGHSLFGNTIYTQQIDGATATIVKITNPNDKGGYRVEQLQTKYPKLTTVEQIRSELTATKGIC